MPDEKRTKKLSAPVTKTELEAFTDACGVVDVKPADTLRQLAAAFVASIKANKSITIPIRIATKPPFR
jgi:hypothetical protein